MRECASTRKSRAVRRATRRPLRKARRTVRDRRDPAPRLLSEADRPRSKYGAVRGRGPSRRLSGFSKSRLPDASRAGCCSPLPKVRGVRGSESPLARRAVLAADSRGVVGFSLGPLTIPWLAASAESPALRRRRAARRPRTSSGRTRPRVLLAPRTRALLASQRAEPHCP
jgi:hypothetical protein